VGLAVVGGLLAVAATLARPPGDQRSAPALAAQPTMAEGTGTPIVDPEPSPGPPAGPVYLPRLMAVYDTHSPGPVLAEAQGYVADLSPAGRLACSPATHVLLRRPEGTVGSTPVAVLYRASTDPNTNLDFYVNRLVTVTGRDSIAPAACRSLTWELLAVEKVEQIEQPPGSD
jgi:hypothetical protein